MPKACAAKVASESGKNPRFGRGSAEMAVRVGSHPSGELVAGAQPELAVDVGQVRLHGLHTHEQRGGDLLVGLPVRDSFGYPLLGRGEVEGARRPPADPAELDA